MNDYYDDCMAGKKLMPDTDEQTGTDYSAVAILILLLPVFLLFRHFGRIDLALPACIYLGMILVAIRIRWDLRKHLWFWCTVIIVLLLQTLAIILIPFPHITVTRITILPIGLADFLIILGVIRFVETVIIKAVPPQDEE